MATNTRTTERGRKRRFDARRVAGVLLLGLGGLTAGATLTAFREAAPPQPAPAATEFRVATLPSGRQVLLLPANARDGVRTLRPIARTRRS